MRLPPPPRLSPLSRTHPPLFGVLVLPRKTSVRRFDHGYANQPRLPWPRWPVSGKSPVSVLSDSPNENGGSRSLPAVEGGTCLGATRRPGSSHPPGPAGASVTEGPGPRDHVAQEPGVCAAWGGCTALGVPAARRARRVVFLQLEEKPRHSPTEAAAPDGGRCTRPRPRRRAAGHARQPDPGLTGKARWVSGHGGGRSGCLPSPHGVPRPKQGELSVHR